MEEPTINYKRLYELSIIEKEKLLLELENNKLIIDQLKNELNTYKI